MPGLRNRSIHIRTHAVGGVEHSFIAAESSHARVRYKGSHVGATSCTEH